MWLIKILLGQLSIRTIIIFSCLKYGRQSFQNTNLHTAGWLEPMYLSTLAVLTWKRLSSPISGQFPAQATGQDWDSSYQAMAQVENEYGVTHYKTAHHKGFNILIAQDVLLTYHIGLSQLLKSSTSDFLRHRQESCTPRTVCLPSQGKHSFLSRGLSLSSSLDSSSVFLLTAILSSSPRSFIGG